MTKMPNDLEAGFRELFKDMKTALSACNKERMAYKKALLKIQNEGEEIYPLNIYKMMDIATEVIDKFSKKG